MHMNYDELFLCILAIYACTRYFVVEAAAIYEVFFLN